MLFISSPYQISAPHVGDWPLLFTSPWAPIGSFPAEFSQWRCDGGHREIRGCWLPIQVSSPHRAASPRHLLFNGLWLQPRVGTASHACWTLGALPSHVWSYSPTQASENSPFIEVSSTQPSNSDFCSLPGLWKTLYVIFKLQCLGMIELFFPQVTAALGMWSPGPIHWGDWFWGTALHAGAWPSCWAVLPSFTIGGTAATAPGEASPGLMETESACTWMDVSQQ